MHDIFSEMRKLEMLQRYGIHAGRISFIQLAESRFMAFRDLFQQNMSHYAGVAVSNGCVYTVKIADFFPAINYFILAAAHLIFLL